MSRSRMNEKVAF